MFAIPRLAIIAAVIALSLSPLHAEPLPRFTEAREAAALHFVKRRCPEFLPLLEDLKKTNRAEYELQIRETFQVTEWLAELQDDEKRYTIELRMWKAENKALVLVAKLASAKDDDRKLIEGQLRDLAKELVELDQQSLEHRVELLQSELAAAKEDLAKSLEHRDRDLKSRYESLLQKARKKKP